MLTTSNLSFITRLEPRQKILKRREITQRKSKISQKHPRTCLCLQSFPFWMQSGASCGKLVRDQQALLTISLKLYQLRFLTGKLRWIVGATKCTALLMSSQKWQQ
jgi:hypothetical protein